MPIKLEGLPEVLEMLERKAFMDLSEPLGKACALVEAAAIQKAPKGTGELRRSIRSKVENNIGTVFTPLEYAPYIEYGTGLFAEEGGRKDVPWHYKDDEGNWHTTSGMHPQPYMRPALNENRDKIIEILKEGIING
jgi:HK97 gp10 family phage protein